MAACLVCTSISVSAAEEAAFSVSGMTTEYLQDPVGIEADSVHFGWQMDSGIIGKMQSAYQIQVYRAGNDEPVWDSGKVESRDSVGIPYGGGTPLEEGTAYQWTVTVWDEDGVSVTSDMGTFETGVSNQDTWQNAEFIRLNQSSSAPIFRTEQELQGEVASARLYITALGAYQAYINGERVGTVDAEGNTEYHHMNPGYGNGNVSLGYQTYDVTSLLEGENTAAVSVLAGNGWKFGLATTSAQPAVKAWLKVTYTDGSRQDIVTNTSDWKGTLDGGIIRNGIYYGEDYDARLAEELGDFTQVGYDDSSWCSAENTEEIQIPVIENTFDEQTARYVRLTVNKTGPATTGDNENRLQIMEVELLNEDGTNVVSGLTTEDGALSVSNVFEGYDAWQPDHLTDGDYGTDSDYGYSSNILGYNGTEYDISSEPITVEFDLGSEQSFQTLRMYPRVQTDSISGQECPNYPRNYTLQVSSDGQQWSDVLTGRETGAVRNTVKYPDQEIYAGSRFDETETQHLRISISGLGPAVAEDNENRLQIMELEALDGAGNNYAAEAEISIDTNGVAGVDQWAQANLTDGDYGKETDRGYSSDILGYGSNGPVLDNPIHITLTFDTPVSISEIRMYARTLKTSLTEGVCPNYPKVYTVETSADGQSWTELASEDEGLLRSTKTAMSTTTFDGDIRAQVGIPGKFIPAYDADPVSVTVYQGNRETSEYPGGEVNVISEADGLGEGITLNPGQTMIINMGQNMSAVPQMEFAGAEGTQLTMRFGEMLNDGSASGNGATQADGPRGSLYQKSVRGARTSVVYTFAGEAREQYTPSMSFFGYQYIEITATDTVTIYAAKSKALSSVSEQTGNIVTNNENVNKLFSNVIYGQLSNYFTTATDCNQRDERLAWAGDTQAFAQTAVYNFNSVPFLSDLQDIMSENIMIKGYVPSVIDDLTGFFSNWGAGWSDVGIINPWVLYQQTGDESVLRENWDAMVHYMDTMQANEHGANHAPIDLGGGNNYGDWLSFQGTSVEVISDYYYGYVTMLMSRIAGVLGETEKQNEYEQKFEALKETFLDSYVTFENGNLVIDSGNTATQNYQFFGQGYNSDGSPMKGGVWEDNSQTSLLWMLKLGYYDSDEMKEAAEELLVENIRNENPDESSIRADYGENTLAAGFLGANVITPVLSDNGHADVAYDLLLQDEQPSWLYEVEAGATTVWERWNSYTEGVGFGDAEMNSFNHYAYGAVVEWMYRYMAGITADEENPGFKHIILQPALDTGADYNDQARINSVEGTYDSYLGTITSAWTSQGEGENAELVTYHTVIPANTTATLYLPVDESAIEGFEAVEGVSGVEAAEHNGQMTVKLELESGGYDFTVQDGRLTVAYAEGYTADGSGSGQPGGEDPVVENVVITPDSAELEKGQTQQFTAEVTGQNDPSQDVIWSVEGAESDNTAISTDGVLTVGDDETAEELTVTAVSAVDETVSASVTVTIKIDEEPGGEPGEPEDPDKPGTEDPDTPGTEDPDKPGTEDPDDPDAENPDNPGQDDEDAPGTSGPGQDTEPPGVSDTGDNGNSSGLDGQDVTTAAQTGDQTSVLPTAAAAVISLLVLAGCKAVIYRRKH